jgi:hypothetical protein
MSERSREGGAFVPDPAVIQANQERQKDLSVLVASGCLACTARFGGMLPVNAEADGSRIECPITGTALAARVTEETLREASLCGVPALYADVYDRRAVGVTEVDVANACPFLEIEEAVADE